MKRALLATLILAFPYLVSQPIHAGLYKVVLVTDGDTIKIRAPGSISDFTICLVGIDAPETSKKKNEPSQPFSQKSTEYLAGLVLNKSIDIKSYGTDRDRYGRRSRG